MSEPENFLNRWSRRKRAPEAETAPPKEAAPETPAETDEAVRDSKPAVTEAPQAPLPEFDVSSLPSLDSIDAQTDIRVFLQAGVPSDLRVGDVVAFPAPNSTIRSASPPRAASSPAARRTISSARSARGCAWR